MSAPAGKKKAGVGAKKAGSAPKTGVKSLLSEAETRAIQSAVLPPEVQETVPKPDLPVSQPPPLTTDPVPPVSPSVDTPSTPPLTLEPSTIETPSVALPLETPLISVVEAPIQAETHEGDVTDVVSTESKVIEQSSDLPVAETEAVPVSMEPAVESEIGVEIQAKTEVSESGKVESGIAVESVTEGMSDVGGRQEEEGKAVVTDAPQSMEVTGVSRQEEEGKAVVPESVEVTTVSIQEEEKLAALEVTGDTLSVEKEKEVAVVPQSVEVTDVTMQEGEGKAVIPQSVEVTTVSIHEEEKLATLEVTDDTLPVEKEKEVVPDIPQSVEVTDASIQEEEKQAAQQSVELTTVTETPLIEHKESVVGVDMEQSEFGEVVRVGMEEGKEMEPEKMEIAQVTEPIVTVSEQKLTVPKTKLVDSSVQTPGSQDSGTHADMKLIVTAPVDSPIHSSSPVISPRSKPPSKRNSEFPQPISRTATETYSTLDDFVSKSDPPMRKFPTFQPDSSTEIMSFDEFLTTIDDPPKAPKSLRSSINALPKNEEENKQKRVVFQLEKSVLKRQTAPKVAIIDPEIDKMKQLAKEKEAKRAQRVQAATKIQARIRGILARKRFLVLRKRYEKTKIKAKLDQLREQIRITWAPYRILKALKVTFNSALAPQTERKESEFTASLPTPLRVIDPASLPRISREEGLPTCAKPQNSRSKADGGCANRLENKENIEIPEGEKYRVSVERNDGVD